MCRALQLCDPPPVITVSLVSFLRRFILVWLLFVGVGVRRSEATMHYAYIYKHERPCHLGISTQQGDALGLYDYNLECNLCNMI